MNQARTMLSRLRTTSRHCRRFWPTFEPCLARTTTTFTSRRTLTTVTEDGWRDLLSLNGVPPGVIFDNPWDTGSTRLANLSDPVADTVTRHVIQLLQELYLTGRPRSADRITTERCNTVLQRLVSIADSSDRAHAILELMRLFRRDPTSQRQPMEFPFPDRDTYRHVLQIDSSRNGGGRPWRTHALVEEMERRYREEGELALKPHAFHWNCVLLAWKETDDWEKSVHAARVLFDLHEKDRQILNVTSYMTVLRICAHQHANEKAAVLGANVAIKLWQIVIEAGEMMKEDILDFPSHFYSVFLQAIRCLPNDNDLRWQYFGRCFGRACQQGKVNAVVLNEFLVHSRSRRLSDTYLGEYKEQVRGLSPEDAVKVLMQKIPSSWTERADMLSDKKNAGPGKR